MSRTCPDCHNIYDDEVLHCPEDGRGLSDVPPVDELIGRTIGSYRIVSSSARAAWAPCTSAAPGHRQQGGGEVPAPAASPATAQIVDRFFNEARAVNLIGHENIVKTLDFSVTPDDVTTS